MKKNQSEKIKVLLEMRPALEGFAGIPQEVRLLFRGLCKIDGVVVSGMLQTSHKKLSRGMPYKKNIFSNLITRNYEINRYSRVVVSMADNPFKTFIEKIYSLFERKLYSASVTFKTITFGNLIKLSRFDTLSFEDFIWRSMFSKTLPSSDFSLVTTQDFSVNTVPWRLMHIIGLNTLSIRRTPKYPRIDTENFDVFIGQTPYPGSVNKKTKMIIRYHDAIPIFMPHTIPEKSIHQATHYYALMSNVKNGAWFSCVSEATRTDLLKIFPEVEHRSVVIHNMVSHHYFDEESSPESIPVILRARYSTDWSPNFLTLREKENFFIRNLPKPNDKYLLIVSTIEPRKNHLRLLAAWEAIKSDVDPSIKLVVVGTLGWDNDAIKKSFSTWIDRGQLFMLNAVPAPELRILYKHASATICPSLGEGFDYSGVESMASGGITIASDILVHKEIYGNAAQYFDPYSTASLVSVLMKVLYKNGSKDIISTMKKMGIDIANRYKPEKILPEWNEFIKKVMEAK